MAEGRSPEDGVTAVTDMTAVPPHGLTWKGVALDPGSDTVQTLPDITLDKVPMMVLHNVGHLHTADGRCISRRAGEKCTPPDAFDAAMDGYDDSVVNLTTEKWSEMGDSQALSNLHIHVNGGCVQRGNSLPLCEKVAYPEHEKMAKVRDQSQALGEFLEWLGSMGVDDLTVDGRRFNLGCDIEPLLGTYFDIDLEKIETEKQDMLGAVRIRNHAADVLAKRRARRV